MFRRVQSAPATAARDVMILLAFRTKDALTSLTKMLGQLIEVTAD